MSGITIITKRGDKIVNEPELTREEKPVDTKELYNKALDNRDALKLLIDKGIVKGKQADDIAAIIDELDAVINELA